MGSGFSFHSRANPPSPELSLGDLPEGCVASVLAYLDPTEISRLSVLNRAFRGASSADFVWESKLPPNYDSIIRRVFDDFLPSDLCKKELYTRLCRQNSFDGGTKKAWLDKSTGGVCLSISSRGLAITGIDDRRYWNHIPTEESRFGTAAYLQQIWWFEVDGEVQFPFPPGTYSLFFRLHLGRASRRFGRRVCNSEHVHGWDIKPVQFQLSTSDGQEAISQCLLEESGKWIHCHVGDFVVDKFGVPTTVKVSMTQIDCTHTKGKLKLNTDGCFYESSNTAGYGGALRDSSRKWVLGFYGKASGTSSLEVEIWAIYRGLLVIFEKGFSSVILESDSSIAVNFCNEGLPLDHPQRHIIEEVRRLVGGTNSTITHIYRQANQIADCLARLDAQQEDDLIVTSSIPFAAREFALADAMGVGHLRT